MTYRRADHVAWRQIGDETIVLDLVAKEMFGLNRSAGRLWRELDASGLDPSGLDADSREILRQLAELSLIEETTEPVVREPVDTGPAVVQVVEHDVEDQEPPAILWREAVEQAAATCAFLPGMNVLCNSAPFS